MSHTGRFPTVSPGMNHDGMPSELTQLGELIASIRSARKTEFEIAYQKVVESEHRRHRLLDLVQDALSQLRLDVKYLIFDLDATRQERDELRRQLDELT